MWLKLLESFTTVLQRQDYCRKSQLHPRLQLCSSLLVSRVPFLRLHSEADKRRGKRWESAPEMILQSSTCTFGFIMNQYLKRLLAAPSGVGFESTPTLFFLQAICSLHRSVLFQTGLNVICGTYSRAAVYIIRVKFDFKVQQRTPKKESTQWTGCGITIHTFRINVQSKIKVPNVFSRVLLQICRLIKSLAHLDSGRCD